MSELRLMADDAVQRLRLDEARAALGNAQTVSDLKAIRDQADAVRMQAKLMNLDFELLNLAAELKLQVERRIGRLLIEMKLRGGDRRSKAPPEPLKLRDLGIDKNQSARWQLEASVPEAEFCQFVRTSHAANREITSAGLIRLAKELKEDWPSDGAPPPNVADQFIRLDSYLPGPPPPPISKPQREVCELAELVVDAKNHTQLAVQLFESICERTGVRPEEGLYRALRRYLTETESHLESIGKGLRRLARHEPFSLPAWPATATQ